MSFLISDSLIPFASELASTLQAKQFTVALLVPESEDNPPARVPGIPWNRPSALSARTVIVEAKNSFPVLDQAVVVFDTAQAATLLSENSTTSGIVDDFIKGYLLLVGELVRHFTVQKKGRLVFVLRPVIAGTINPSLQNIALFAAESAFLRLAEETAASFSSGPAQDIQALLVKLETTGDAENLEWLVEQLAQPSLSRNQGRWIKAGSRVLFGKL